MKMNSVLTDLTFIKKVRSPRQENYVYKNHNSYVVFRASRQKETTHYINVLPDKAIKYILKRYSGDIVSVKEINMHEEKSYWLNDYDILDTFYSMVAEGSAKIDHRVGHELYFKIK